MDGPFAAEPDDSSELLWELFLERYPQWRHLGDRFPDDGLESEPYNAWEDFIRFEAQALLKGKIAESTAPDPGYWTRRAPIDGPPEEEPQRRAEEVVRRLGIRHPEQSKVQFRMVRGRWPSPEEEALRRELLRGNPDPRIVE